MSGIHLRIECALLYVDLVTATPISKSSLETCQDFALVSLKERRVVALGQGGTSIGGNSHLQLLG